MIALGGRPPFAPLARAAAALAALLALPPLRPRATAAGFLRRLRDTLPATGFGAIGIGEHDPAVFDRGGRSAAVRVTHVLGGLLEAVAGARIIGRECGCHAQSITEPLGFVKWA